MRLAVTFFILLVSCITDITNVDTLVQEISVEISNEGLDLIKDFEGYRSLPYLDSGGVPTIGFGTIQYPDGTPVKINDPKITEDQALEFLRSSVTKKCESINNMLKSTINQNQFDALCSFTYNLGVTALHNSTLLKLINEGNLTAAAEEFPKWVHDNGKTLPGLEKRRLAEQQLFMGENNVASN